MFQTRTVPGAVEKMEEILHWAGLVADESKYGTFMYEITSCFSVFLYNLKLIIFKAVCWMKVNLTLSWNKFIIISYFSGF